MYKILVMEDDPVIYEELQFLLRLQGYEPVDDFPCGLALLDVNLPGKMVLKSRVQYVKRLTFRLFF